MIIVTDPNEAALQANGTLPSPADTHTGAQRHDGLQGTRRATTRPTTTRRSRAQRRAPAGTGRAAPGRPLRHADRPGRQPTPPLPEGDPEHHTAECGVRERGPDVLTNGKNVGVRAAPRRRRARSTAKRRAQRRPGQGCVCSSSTPRDPLHPAPPDHSGGTQVPLVRVGGEGGLLDNAVVEGGVRTGFDTSTTPARSCSAGQRADVVAAIPAEPAACRRSGPRTSTAPAAVREHSDRAGRAPQGHRDAGHRRTPSPRARRCGATGDTIPVRSARGTLLNPATFHPPKPGTGPTLTTPGRFNSTGYGTHRHPRRLQGRPAPRLDPLGQARRHAGADGDETTGPTIRSTCTGSRSSRSPDPRGNPKYTFPPEFRDNIDIPPNYTLTFRIKLEDRPLMDGVTPGGGRPLALPLPHLPPRPPRHDLGARGHRRQRQREPVPRHAHHVRAGGRGRHR